MPPSYDWRSPTAMQHLETADLEDLALEYLRRNPAFRRDHDRLARQIGSGVIDPASANSMLSKSWGVSFRPTDRAIEARTRSALDRSGTAHRYCL